ncbi:hypothetical protein RFI_13280 [Reticulomyxa filosa]|uniref:Uncharacterized protein n=1 Tax=Reticulomyxa filosa TaxID=46433 RepID=X6NDT1_RETFI|nr:hypothetical protein RFI_13280 [Reticulomyxa filosa]|eukprot:ETO23879.1 hypothetical protein RFI_13280 [Reticulomyxa filosa]
MENPISFFFFPSFAETYQSTNLKLLTDTKKKHRKVFTYDQSEYCRNTREGQASQDCDTKTEEEIACNCEESSTFVCLLLRFFPLQERQRKRKKKKKYDNEKCKVCNTRHQRSHIKVSLHGRMEHASKSKGREWRTAEYNEERADQSLGRRCWTASMVREFYDAIATSFSSSCLRKRGGESGHEWNEDKDKTKGEGKEERHYQTLDPLDNCFESLSLSDRSHTYTYQVDLLMIPEPFACEMLSFQPGNRSYTNKSLFYLYTPQELRELKAFDDIRRALTSQKTIP